MGKYNNCPRFEGRKKGSRINFQYTGDVDRLNNCGGNNNYYEGKTCGWAGPVGSGIGGLTPEQLANEQDYDIMQRKMNIPPNNDPNCCKNLGMYTYYRGRCDDYGQYMNDYNPVNGI